jgi:hypothetical protein
VNIRNVRHVFYQPPIRLSLSDYTSKLCQHSQAVAAWRLSPSARKILAWWPADDADEVTDRWVEVFDALPQECVRSSHHTEADLLKTFVQKSSAGKE